jgi:hypothetical protein
MTLRRDEDLKKRVGAYDLKRNTEREYAFFKSSTLLNV